MWDKIKKKAKAAIPKVTNAAKSVGKAVVNTAKKAGKAIANTAKKAGNAVANSKVGKAVANSKVGKAVANSKVAKLVSKAVAAVPAGVKKVGDTAKKVKAAIPKYVNAGKQKVIETTNAVKKTVEKGKKAVNDAAQRVNDEVARKNDNILIKLKAEVDVYWQDVERGKTRNGAEYEKSVRASLDSYNLYLQARKAVIEEYPILAWKEIALKSAHHGIRDGITKYGDKFGNFVYNKDIPILSDFTGALLNASDMEDNGSASSVIGSFLHGVLGTGALGTIDGLAGLVSDPRGVIESVNNIARCPEEALPAIWDGIKTAWNDEIIEGSAESRSRAVGAVAFEIITTIATGGASAAVQAGDKVADVGRVAKGLDRISDTGKMVKRIPGALKQVASKGMTKALTSKVAGSMAMSGDELIRSMNKLLNPPGPSLGFATGYLDDVDDVGRFQSMYDELLKARKTAGSESGVKIHKAADLVDEAGVVKGGSGAKPNTSPKTRLPRTNGKWSGEAGNGKWFSNKPEVNKITGGEGVYFKNGRPDFSPWSKGDLKFKPGQLNGTPNDFSLVYEKIQQQYKLPSKNAAKKLLKDIGVAPHHKAPTKIELIPSDLHGNIPHIGSAADMRGGF